MPGQAPRYSYAKVDDLEGTSKVGNGQCVALVQHYAGAPVTANWRQGILVRGATDLIKGAAIATFENGRYSNNAHGNHAALYISQDAEGITVMDQWTSKEAVSSRKILFKGKNRRGKIVDPSNNGDAFHVSR